MGSELSGRHKLEFDYSKVTELASLGLTQAQIATGLGIGKRTVSRRLSDDDKFASAYEAGAVRLTVQMSNILIEAALNGDIDAAKFILDRKCGWNKNIKSNVDLNLSAPTLKIILNGEFPGETIDQITLANPS